jgi:hypothetical protein
MADPELVEVRGPDPTLIELAKRQRVKLPSYTEDGLRRLVFKGKYANLPEYLKGFAYTCAVMQTAESPVKKDATRGYGTSLAVRCSLPEPKMRAIFVVVANILEEQSLQMAFIHGNDVIQQVPSTAFNPALRDAVLPGAFEGRSHWTHLQGSNGCENPSPYFASRSKMRKRRAPGDFLTECLRAGTFPFDSLPDCGGQ